MVDLQPQPFSTASPVLANYSYSDIVNGFGYKNYYGLTSEDSTGTDFILTEQTNYTAVVLNDAADIDIDTPTFNTPQTVEGDIIIQMSYGGTNMAGSDNVRAVITVYHYDGSSETSLGTITSPLKSGSGAGINTDRSTTMILPIPRTVFAVGDLLRINVVSSGNNTLKLYLSPNNLGTPYTSALHTQFIASIPFLLDL